MHYYKKSDLAKLYGVNPRTITRWIDDAEEGKLGIELHEEGGRYHIAKTSKNQRVMLQLTEERRKYLNKLNLKLVTPSEEFYKTYSEEQILEIFSGIDTDREIALKFSYFQDGAYSWDAFTHQMLKSDAPQQLTNTIKLLDLNMSYLEEALRNYPEVNVIDVGVGNALPSRNLLSHLLKIGKLKRYVAIDISPDMLSIAEKNTKDWFGDKIKFESYIYDISVEPFPEIISEPPNGAINLVLLLGGTLANFKDPEGALKVIRRSMYKNDLLIYTKKLDSPLVREQFDVLAKKEGQLLPPQCEYVLSLLGIDESLYSVEQVYDEVERARIMRIRLKHALTLKFQLSRGIWHIDLNKAETITVWRASHSNHYEIEDQLQSAGFSTLQKSQTIIHDYILLIANLERKGVHL